MTCIRKTFVSVGGIVFTLLLVFISSEGRVWGVGSAASEEPKLTFAQKRALIEQRALVLCQQITKDVTTSQGELSPPQSKECARVLADAPRKPKARATKRPPPKLVFNPPAAQVIKSRMIKLMKTKFGGVEKAKKIRGLVWEETGVLPGTEESFAERWMRPGNPAERQRDVLLAAEGLVALHQKHLLHLALGKETLKAVSTPIDTKVGIAALDQTFDLDQKILPLLEKPHFRKKAEAMVSSSFVAPESIDSDRIVKKRSDWLSFKGADKVRKERVLKQNVFSMGVLLESALNPTRESNYEVSFKELRGEEKAGHSDFTKKSELRRIPVDIYQEEVAKLHADKTKAYQENLKKQNAGRPFLSRFKRRDSMEKLILDATNPDPDKRPTAQQFFRRLKKLSPQVSL